MGPLSLIEGLKPPSSGLGLSLPQTRTAIPALIGLPQFSPPIDTTSHALKSAIAEGTTAKAALAYMVLVLLYTPCVATVGAIRQEFGKRWATISVVYQLVIAFGLSWVAFNK